MLERLVCMEWSFQCCTTIQKRGTQGKSWWMIFFSVCIFGVGCWSHWKKKSVAPKGKKTLAKETVNKKRSHNTWDCNFQCSTQMKMNMIILRAVRKTNALLNKVRNSSVSKANFSTCSKLFPIFFVRFVVNCLLKIAGAPNRFSFTHL